MRAVLCRVARFCAQRRSVAAVTSVISICTLAPSVAFAAVSPLTAPAQITRLATKACVWGLAPEFVYRFMHYSNLVNAPLNTLGGGKAAAAWNNSAMNAGDPSVLYLNAMIDLSGQKARGGTKALVLTVPPSSGNYYVAAVLDDFINTVGSIGARTTPSTSAQTYLLVGPTSQYAHKRTVRIHGFTYRVLTVDTTFGWISIRIRADTLVPASDPASAASILKNVVERFALNTLTKFEANGHRPIYFQPGQYTPTERQQKLADRLWHNAPGSAVVFFKQMGQSLRLNPLPSARTGLGGIPLSTLPSWVTPQYGAATRYRSPSYGQAVTLGQFRPLGLTANGFKIPGNWGPRQVAALRAGYVVGQKEVNVAMDKIGASSKTNFWSYLNNIIGTYPNTSMGYLLRAVIVLAGGSANVPLDAVYAQSNNLDGTSNTQLDGNNAYELTFTPPVANPTLPVIGSLPPTVNDGQGNPLGFWSISLYQPDTSESSAPFISQSSVLNTAYSTPNIPVTAINPSSNTITVEPSSWAPLIASSPVLFGATAAQYGLTPGVPYYVRSTPTKETDPTTGTTTYTFQISTLWKQSLSAGNVPIQNSGTPGPVVNLSNPGGAVNLEWGPIQPVSQLGSQQLTSGKLVKNADGSVTIWIAPKLPAGAPATNWLPSPSTAYYATIYPGSKVSTQIRPLIRIYYPTPGSNTQASILPPPNGSMQATYLFPAIQKVN